VAAEAVHEHYGRRRRVAGAEVAAEEVAVR
jgi:hypothetical protein